MAAFEERLNMLAGAEAVKMPNSCSKAINCTAHGMTVPGGSMRCSVTRTEFIPSVPSTR